MAYFSPDTVDNQRLRQLLSHFFNITLRRHQLTSKSWQRFFLLLFPSSPTDLILARSSLIPCRSLVNTEKSYPPTPRFSPALIIGHFMTWTNPYNFRFAVIGLLIDRSNV